MNVLFLFDAEYNWLMVVVGYRNDLYNLMKLHASMRTISRGLSALKNVANFFPFYYEYNAYLFDRRYRQGLAHWCAISDGLSNWLGELREKAVALAPEGRILEVGCEDGKLTSRLSKYSREVIGLDISAEAIQLAKQYQNGNLKFYVHNIEWHPLDGENSLIICEDVLYYIPFVSIKKVASKLSKALLCGEILLVIDYLPEYMDTRCSTDYDQNS